MDNSQRSPITHFDGLLAVGTPQEKAKLLSAIYDPKSTREQIQHTVLEISKTHGLSLSDSEVNSILTYANQSLDRVQNDELQEKKEKERRRSHHNEEPAHSNDFIDHNKYQDEITKNLREQHAQNSIQELDTNHDVLTAEQTSQAEKEEAQRLGKEITDLTIEEKARADTVYRRQLQFQKILERNSTLEGIIQEQHELLAKQLEENNNPQTAERVRKRAAELTQERSAEKETRQKEFDGLEREGGIADIKAKLQRLGQDLSKLTPDERARYVRYQELQPLVHRDRREAMRENRNFDTSIWMQRFRNCKTIEEQNSLMREFLRLQHTRTAGEVSKIFNLKEKGRFTRDYLKTLSRKERRLLLNTQRQQMNTHLPQKPPKVRRINFDSFFGMDLSAINQWARSEYSQESQDSSPNLPSFPNPMNAFNSTRNMFDAVKNLNNLSRFFGGGGVGGAGGAAGGAGAAGAGGAAVGTPVLIVILIVLAIILFIVLLCVIIAATNHGQSFSTQLVQLTCGDLKDIPAQDNVVQMEKVFIKRFGGNNSPIITPVGDQQDVRVETVSVKQEERLYSVICVLFGHVTGSVYQDPTHPSSFNTFGTTVVGTPDQRLHMLENRLAMFKLLFSVRVEDTQYCSIEYLTKQDSDISPTYQWIFHHPESCSDGRFQFLTAQWLAHASIIQQQRLAQQHKKVNEVYKLFNNTPDAAGVIGKDGILPTFDCQKSVNYGENANDQQNRNCFADMVGSYLTYPLYNDLASTKSASLTTANGSSSATFASFPTSYPTYFLFAKNNLFDGMEFFTNSLTGTSIACPTTDPVDSPSMIKTLTAYFNITLLGPGVTDSKFVTDMYHTVCKLAKYRYIQLLQVPKTPISVYLYNDFQCSGHTQPDEKGYSVDHLHSCNSSAGNEFMLTHELGHIIQWLNPGLENQFCTNVYGGKLVKYGTDYACQSKGYAFNTIPTYNCLYDYPKLPPPYMEECFSDMVGSFLTYKQFADTVNGSPKDAYKMGNYPSNFPSYYNFAATNVFSPIPQTTGGIIGFVDTAQAITSHLIKTFGRTVDFFDQLDTRPNALYLTNSPSPKYAVVMRSGTSCAKINGDLSCIYQRYYCTDLLIDSYNITLKNKVLGEDLGSVENMIAFFKKSSSQGFGLIHYRNATEHKQALEQLYTGNVTFGNPIFFESVEGVHNGAEHVGMIRDIVLNTNQKGQYTGDGYIDTYEANSSKTTFRYIISNWNITNVPYPVTGFGTYTPK